MNIWENDYKIYMKTINEIISFIDHFYQPHEHKIISGDDWQMLKNAINCQTNNKHVKIFEKEYYGFEDSSDVDRDVSEAMNAEFNPIWKSIGGEWLGTLKITLEYNE